MMKKTGNRKYRWTVPLKGMCYKIFYHYFFLSGVHHSAETISAVCITPLSQSPRCASHCVVIVLNFSAVKITIFQKTLRYASLLGDNLRGVHHSTETISTVCITPHRQTAHCKVKIEIFACLWLLLKEQSVEIILGVSTS